MTQGAPGPLGIVMLAHTALHRAEQVIRYWADAGCAVVVHLDRAVPAKRVEGFRTALADLPRVEVLHRHRCEWGTWSLVAATQDAAERLLARYPEVRHVLLTSGSCLPVKPAAALIDHLAQHPRTDFIESAAIADAPWAKGGLQAERFTLHFPISWRRFRWGFDRLVDLQRALGIKRRMPPGLTPHMGSQWWCLTRQTLTAILQDPARTAHDRYFKRVWIPDEAYFQTLVRHYGTQVESRSLTFSRFDHQGKPYIFYDDHLPLLRRTDRFLARKIWPGADALYDSFLADGGARIKPAEADPARLERVFARAQARRAKGRPGLYSPARFPSGAADRTPTARPYTVLQGFGDLFDGFDDWLAQATGLAPHGALFAKDRVQFHGDPPVWKGGLSDAAAIRDADPKAFLSSVVRAGGASQTVFSYSPRDLPKAAEVLARDPNARLFVITGAWAIPLFQTNADFADLRAEAARLQKLEAAALALWSGPDARAQLTRWSLAEFIDAPMDGLQAVLATLDLPRKRLSAAPRLRDLTGFGQFLQNLRNQGMTPHLVGDYPARDPLRHDPDGPQKPYLVKR